MSHWEVGKEGRENKWKTTNSSWHLRSWFTWWGTNPASPLCDLLPWCSKPCCDMQHRHLLAQNTTTMKMETYSWRLTLQKPWREQHLGPAMPASYAHGRMPFPLGIAVFSSLTSLRGGPGHNRSLITEYNSSWCPVLFHKRSSKALWLKHHNAPGNYEGTSIIIPIYSQRKWGKGWLISLPKVKQNKERA